MKRLLISYCFAVACGGTPDAPIPADAADAGFADADAGFADAGFADAEPPDATFADAAPDASPLDTGATDSGAPWEPVQVDIDAARAPEQLSAFRFFRYQDGRFEYNSGVVPYALNTPLFSDYALKARAFWIPPGTQIRYESLATFDFPVGSALIKSFIVAPDLRQPERSPTLVETRVLIRHADGWRAYPYLWREDQTDADYFVRGRVSAVSFIDPDGVPRTAQYLVPQRNQCATCHELLDAQGDPQISLIGPKARHLNRVHDHGDGPINQLDHWAELGLLTGLPPDAERPRAFDFERVATGTRSLTAMEIELGARDYLDINCAHCHNPRAVQGVTSQLYLNADNTDPFRLGICKEPGSAGSGAGGRRFDIVPGQPDASILIYRTESETAGELMPLLGRSLRDTHGAALLRAWIGQMPPRSCP